MQQPDNNASKPGGKQEENYKMLEIPVMPGQSGQSELENYQETDTTWEMICLDHDDNYCIDQDEAKNGKLRIRLRLHGRGFKSTRLHDFKAFTRKLFKALFCAFTS